MNKSLCMLSLAAGLILSAHAKLDPNRPEAKPNKELSTIQNFIRNLGDFLGDEALGYQALLPKNEQLIRSIIKDLDMEDYCIEIRGMSNYAQRLVGRINAFVAPSAFGKKAHSYLFISEDWFNTLTSDEKQALIRHELMHIKLDHGDKKGRFSLLSGLGVYVLYHIVSASLKKAYPTQETKIQTLTKSAAWTAWILLLLKHSRDCEKEADIEGAKSMKSKKGFVSLFKNVIVEVRDPESRFLIKRKISNGLSAAFKPLSKLLLSHPELEERIAYIENLAL